MCTCVCCKKTYKQNERFMSEGAKTSCVDERQTKLDERGVRVNVQAKGQCFVFCEIVVGSGVLWQNIREDRLKRLDVETRAGSYPFPL